MRAGRRQALAKLKEGGIFSSLSRALFASAGFSEEEKAEILTYATKWQKDYPKDEVIQEQASSLINKFKDTK